jgi:predicted amidophosphoribosyltransferase
VLLDVPCPLCGRPARPRACTACLAGLPASPGLPRIVGLDRCHALWAYDGATRDLVTELKYRRRRDLVPRVAELLAATARPPGGALVTWAPTAADRRRRRGADHAELLARALARRWSLRCRPLLRRRPGPPQTGRDAAARRRHPGFEVAGPVPRAVVVVDDVATTGATLRAAARALRGAGAVEVVGVVMARTP